jgi:nucleotide-binding universal stress UspA family protein
MKVMKIVVPLDGSTAAETALPEAITLTKQNTGAKLVLVRVVDPTSMPTSAGSDEQARAINEAAEYLETLATRLRSDGVDRVGRAVWFAPPDVAIAETIRTVKPDLIVMSDCHQQRSELGGHLTVLTVRPAERRLRVGAQGDETGRLMPAAEKS